MKHQCRTALDTCDHQIPEDIITDFPQNLYWTSQPAEARSRISGTATGAEQKALRKSQLPRSRHSSYRVDKDVGNEISSTDNLRTARFRVRATGSNWPSKNIHIARGNQVSEKRQDC